MFGYERDQIVKIKANSAKEALAIGKDIDRFAEVTIVERFTA